LSWAAPPGCAMLFLQQGFRHCELGGGGGGAGAVRGLVWTL
jgi:hypothetical protein